MSLTDQSQQDGGVLTGQTLAQIKANAVNPAFSSVSVAGNLSVPTKAAITAKAAGNQANATPLVVGINQITVVATANDAVLLPMAAAGISVVATNATANNAFVYPGVGDQIGVLGANAAFTLPANKTAQFSAIDANNWTSILSA